MTGLRMELGENNNTTHPPLIPCSKRRRHSWLCVVNGIISDSIHPWDLGFVPWRQAASTGGKSKTSSRGFYRNSAFAFVFFILFCSVIAMGKMGLLQVRGRISWCFPGLGRCGACRPVAAEVEVEALLAVGP